MANSERRIIDRKGRTFTPMNVEGGQYESNFLSAGKIAVMIGLGFGLLMVAYYISERDFNILGKMVVIGLVFLVYQFIVRYAILNERYYYKMYKKMLEHKNPTSDIFWSIPSIKEEELGSVITYSDMKNGILVKLNRDTIVGKDEGYEEMHFDALSEMYKMINIKDLKFVQSSSMEKAGNDPRIPVLDEVVRKSKNTNIKKLVEQHLSNIKNISRSTLFESDHILIYTTNIGKFETLMEDVIECMSCAMGGNFVGYDILNKNEIIELHKSMTGVSYFDYSLAIMNTFKNDGMTMANIMNVGSVELKSGEVIKVDKNANLRLKELASCDNEDSIVYGDWSIKSTLGGNTNKMDNRFEEKSSDFVVKVDELIKISSVKTNKVTSTTFDKEEVTDKNETRKPIDF